MTTERELREQERLAEQELEEARNPHSWKNSKWVIIALLVILGVMFISL